MVTIFNNYKKIRSEISNDVTIVVAVKSRSKEDIIQVISAGATDLGENYVQEAREMKGVFESISNKINWHMIGHLQTNKINHALPIFDTIQSVDSFKLAESLNKRTDKILSVYIEVNIAEEDSKDGIKLAEIEEFISSLSNFSNLKICGLMCVEPYSLNLEKVRPYFKKMKKMFDKCKLIDQSNLDLKVLSMGMSNSYKVAIEEGSNMVRLGTCIFGKRTF
ncbi:YggS family pyridoxal phosphate-dependent enzyme [archaeon]|jgi:PLP dependent protein|nr:YggS family pyridoxal phosphate-dependent enzyme [archaeon]